MNVLYVIGNGFDKHHDINSGYDDFYKWLEENGHYEVLSEFEDIYGGGMEWWHELEQNLGEIDMSEYACNQASENYPNFADDAYRDRDLFVAEYAVENDFGGAIQLFQNSFGEWIEGLNPPNENNKINLKKLDSFFINFNYTRTLEDIYRIPSRMVWHPHGAVGDVNTEYVLGHGKSRQQLEQELEQQEPQPPVELDDDELQEFYASNSDLVIDRAKDATLSAVASLRKPVAKIIEQNKELWSRLMDVREIYILGFSFAEVDEPYLAKIVENIHKDSVRWIISQFSKTDIERIHKFIEKYNINPDKVRICTLSELQNEKQMEIQFEQ